MSGYSVEVEELYETQDAVYIETNLLGPEKGEETKDRTTFPYVVVQLEYIERISYLTECEKRATGGEIWN